MFDNRGVWLIVLIKLLFINWSCVHSDEISSNLPCDLRDSINITMGTLHPNKSYTFNGIEFPLGEYAKLNYTLNIITSQVVTVPPYIRGCLCNVKSCVRFCCPYGTYLLLKDNGGECRKHEAAKNIEGEIVDGNNDTQRIKFHQHFGIVHKFPCKNLYIPGEQFKITHKGEAVLDDRTLHQHEYCLMASMNTQTKAINLNLAVCYDNDDGQEFDVITSDSQSKNTYHLDRLILPICMLLSVVFIIVTLIVYAFVPKVRRLNEKCLMCYMLTLGIAFSVLAATQLSELEPTVSVMCTFSGYFLNFSFLSIFLWLNVINFDLWLSFQPSHPFRKFSERKQLIYFMSYGYGVACLFTLMIYTLDQIESIPKLFQPGMGIIGCTLLNGWVQEFIFFYLPASIILLINVILFVQILKRIQHVRKEAKRLEKDSLQNGNVKIQDIINKKKDKIVLYFRIFILAGISWVMEVIWFLAPDSSIFFYSDLFNSLQGVIIFILFVLNRRMLHLIKKKWNTLRSKTSSTEDSLSDSDDGDDFLRMNAIAVP